MSGSRGRDLCRLPRTAVPGSKDESFYRLHRRVLQKPGLRLVTSLSQLLPNALSRARLRVRRRPYAILIDPAALLMLAEKDVLIPGDMVHRFFDNVTAATKRIETIPTPSILQARKRDRFVIPGPSGPGKRLAVSDRADARPFRGLAFPQTNRQCEGGWRRSRQKPLLGPFSKNLSQLLVPETAPRRRSFGNVRRFRTAACRVGGHDPVPTNRSVDSDAQERTSVHLTLEPLKRVSATDYVQSQSPGNAVSRWAMNALTLALGSRLDA